MSEVDAPDYLSTEQSQMVRDLYESFHEFWDQNVVGTPFNQKLHWGVITKFITLSMEFPEVSAISYEHFRNPEAAEVAEDDDYFANDIEASLYWLFLALLDFADMNDTGRLDDLSVFLEEHLTEVAKFCEEYNAEKLAWNN